MYRWDQPAGARDNAAPVQPVRPGQRRSRAGRAPVHHPDEAARAVQEALDRRDNGGDTAAGRDQ
jgi:hypothetical protein